MTTENAAVRSTRVVWGGVLLLLGIALLLDNLNVLYLGSVWDHWPLILVAVGIGRLLAPGSSQDRSSGLWWMFIGCWLYVSVHHLWGLRFSTSWPILLIGIGVSMVWNSLRRGGTHWTMGTKVTFGTGERKGEPS